MYDLFLVRRISIFPKTILPSSGTCMSNSQSTLKNGMFLVADVLQYT